MTTYLTPIVIREMTRQSEIADGIRRRSSGLRYWLLLPFAGLLIYASIIWSSGALAYPTRPANRLRLRR